MKNPIIKKEEIRYQENEDRMTVHMVHRTLQFQRLQNNWQLEGIKKDYDMLALGALPDEYLLKMDGDDLEELDLRWQVAMLTVRVKKSKRSQGRRPYGNNGRSNAQTTESSSQALVAQDGLRVYDWSNDFEVEPVNYALMAISSSSSLSSSNSEVQKCSKCLESFKCLQKNYDTEREKHNKAKLEIRGYEIALESLKQEFLGHGKKNSLVLLRKEMNLKLKMKNRKGIKESHLELNSQMSTHEKMIRNLCTQMDDLRFTKANEYHAVPPPITGNPLTPRADISFAGLDEYAFRNKIIESKTTETNKTVGTTNEATIVKPKSVNETVVSKSKINRDEVIIEDWTSDDEDDVCADKTVSSVKPNVTQAVRSQADKSGQTSQKQGIGFKKVHKIKACFVCKSTGHLIKDCDFYDQKSPEPRVKNVVNTGKRVVKPVWDYGKRVNHQNFSKNLKYPHAKRTFNPSAVLTRAGLVNTVRSNVSTARSISTVRPVYTVRPRSYFTQPVYRPKDLKPDVKTFGVKNMTTVGTRAVVSKGKVENVLKKDKWGNQKILLHDHAVVDSGCSSHMTGNKAYLSDYEDLNGGFVAFRSDPKGELVANAMNDESRQAFEEEKRRIASQKKAAQATSTNQLSTDRPFVSTDRSFVSTDRSNTPNVSAASTSTGANADESSFVYLGGKIPIDASTLPNADLPIDPNMPDLEDASDTLPNDGIFNGAYDDDEDVGAVADFNNMDNTIAVSPIPTLRIHKDHPKGQILGDPTSAVQTRGKIQKASSAQQALVSYIHRQNRTNHKDHQNYLFACFLSQEEPKTISQALKDKSWVEAMQEELLQFKQEEGIDYDEVFAPVARIEAIRLFLAFASYMGSLVYQMDVKSDFLYGTIEEEVYVHQPPGFVDLAHPNKVYKVVKALYGLHQAPRAWYETLSFLLENGFRKGTIDKTLFIKKNKSDIMLVQVYMDDIIFGSTKKSMCTKFEEVMHKRFQMSSMGELTFFLGLQVKQQPDGIFITTTPIESNKPLVKDEDGVEVDVHEYRSMIGSLMYLTASRPDIMFAVCACARFQVTPKASHLHAVKRIFRYLKHQPKLGLWYPRDSPFELEAFSDSDYAGASLDRKSTTGGCQFLGRRLISWQCKKQTIVANSTTEAEYVAAAHCCGQVLWIQNQMMDYGFNFMNTKIHIDNESTICVVKNPVYHSRTKHIEIRHHFIRDCYEKRLIDVLKIHTDSNVADLLTKGFDVTRISMDLRMDRSSPGKYNSSMVYKHNMVAFLKKPNESVGFTEVVDFLKVRTLANGTQQLVASIDSKEYNITEAFVRSKLQLADATRIHNLSDAEIYAGLATLGPKSGGWDQFGSTISTALICLSTNRVYNFSKMIFDEMVHNLESNLKNLMYPRFLQIILDITTEDKGRYLAPTLTKKLLANMKRGYARDIVPLIPAILAGAAVDQGEGSALPTKPHHTPVDPISSTSLPPIPSPPHPSPPT
ncbi:putative ribonuclease H-like domain-containing protein [Tanacetum coccineum]